MPPAVIIMIIVSVSTHVVAIVNKLEQLKLCTVIPRLTEDNSFRNNIR